MAVTESNYTVSNSSTTNYSFTFPYLKTTDVKVSINGTASSAWTFHNPTTVKLNSNPTVGDKIRIYRETDDSDLQATFYAGSSIKASDLNDNFNQTLYVSQESNNKIDTAWTSGDETIDSSETWVSNDLRVSTTQAIDGRIDSKIDTALTGDVVAGNKITVTDNSPSSGKITVAVTSGSLVDSDVNASAAIAGTKVSPNFGSQNISTSGTLGAGNTTVSGNIVVTGTVDGRDVAADGTKLDGIDTGAKDDQTAAEIRVLVEAASDSNVFTDADHTKLNAIEASATADQTAAEIRSLVGSASDSNVFTDADHSKLDGIDTGAKDDQTAAEIKTLIASSPLDASHLAANSVTTSEIADAELTTLAGMQSGTASILADSTALTSTTAELNLLDGKSIVTAVSGSSTDVQLPTAKAVNDQIVNLLNEAGGFVPIANEVSFPNANPDPNDGAGTIVSIADAGGVVVNGSGVSTTGRTLGGATVTINGIDSSLNSTTIAAGKGMLVQTTSTLNTYTYHRLVVDEAGVATAQSLVTSFNERYRVGSSNPSSDNDAGDLFFNTATDKLLVRNAANNSWDEAQSVGNFYISTLSPAFDGSTTDFTITNAPTYASQVLLIINGVLQKPNSGTSAPADGFAIDGSTIKLGGAPATGSTYSAVVIGSTVNIGTPSDNTVSTAIIQNLAVTTGKIAADAVDGTKIADDAVGAEHIEVLDNHLQMTDAGKIKLGTDNDLEVFHSGSHSQVVHNGTGNLYLDAIGASVNLRSGDNAGGVHNSVVCSMNAGVQLYFDANQKFETTSTGVKYTGDLRADDDYRIKLGTSQELNIYHHNSGVSVIENTDQTLKLRAKAGEDGVVITPDGSVDLYYDGSKVLYTNINGATIHASEGSDAKLTFHADEGDDWNDKTRIRASQGEMYIELFNGTDWEDAAQFIHGDAAYLFFNNERRFYTRSNGCTVQGNNAGGGLDFSTDTTHRGTIYYDSSNTLFLMDGQGHNHFKGIKDSFSVLYYDNSNKLYTNSDGVVIAGKCYPEYDNNSNYTCGRSDLRWHTIYAGNGTIQVSDRNKKNTILESDLGLDFVNNLKPVSYRWNQDDGKTHYGLIAQDIEEVLATEGKTDKDFAALDIPTKGSIGLNYSELISPLIKAVQELTTKVETLETKVAALEAK